jgi:hypothetical protein
VAAQPIYSPASATATATAWADDARSRRVWARPTTTAPYRLSVLRSASANVYGHYGATNCPAPDRVHDGLGVGVKSTLLHQRVRGPARTAASTTTTTTRTPGGRRDRHQNTAAGASDDRRQLQLRQRSLQHERPVRHDRGRHRPRTARPHGRRGAPPTTDRSTSSRAGNRSDLHDRHRGSRQQLYASPSEVSSKRRTAGRNRASGWQNAGGDNPGPTRSRRAATGRAAQWRRLRRRIGGGGGGWGNHFGGSARASATGSVRAAEASTVEAAAARRRRRR